MNCLLHACSTVLLSRAGCLVARSSLRGGSTSWNRSCEHAGIRAINLESLSTRFHVHCYSSKKSSKSTSRSRKSDPKPVIKDEKAEFFVVRKGDVVGVYKSLSDCQAQVGSSICDPPVSVYKGHSLPKETEEYLLSRGLKNAVYSIRAADLEEDLFGMLMPCPFQQPSLKDEISKDPLTTKSQEVLGSEIMEAVESNSILIDPVRTCAELGDPADTQSVFTDSHSCILEFDGASKGNPGQAGAGAILRSVNGSLICRLREGLGKATCNAAEYRAMILGLKYALKKGYTHIRVQGDSKLVCMQVQGQWKVKNQNMSKLYAATKELKNEFLSFQISHVLRNLNSEADAQANLAVNLADGQVQEEFED
ncbi:uncharacterized protein LOC131145236 isoform X1 [Malania oleifera]|uniref:uncharacterized protein LOC131145236 isoform X1 n=1 Tax=Malania oleifera TaxID=397392 RepID=UPI0025ADCAFF|nr:uncharacterized protein LOC131145236 isoform X1 [Malania oleifera]XP_057950369.1 uncharacterized protein LOC131145236 isoform X1 [Malania oleifera]